MFSLEPTYKPVKFEKEYISQIKKFLKSQISFSDIKNLYLSAFLSDSTSSNSLKILILNQKIFKFFEDYLEKVNFKSISEEKVCIEKISEVLNFIKKNEASQKAYSNPLSRNDLQKYLNSVCKFNLLGSIFSHKLISRVGLKIPNDISISNFSKLIWTEYTCHTERKNIDFFQAYKIAISDKFKLESNLSKKFKSTFRQFLLEISAINTLKSINSTCPIEKTEIEQIKELLVKDKLIHIKSLKSKLTKKNTILEVLENERKVVNVDFNLKILFDYKNEIIIFRFNHRVIDGVFARRFCIYFLEKFRDIFTNFKSQELNLKFVETLPTNTLIAEFINHNIKKLLPNVCSTFQVNQAEIGARVSPRFMKEKYSFLEQKIAKIGVPSMWLSLWAHVAKLPTTLEKPVLNICKLLGIIKIGKKDLLPTVIISSQGLFQSSKYYKQILASTAGSDTSILNIAYTFVEDSKNFVSLQIFVEKGNYFEKDKNLKKYKYDFKIFKKILIKSMREDFRNVHTKFSHLSLSFN